MQLPEVGARPFLARRPSVHPQGDRETQIMISHADNVECGFDRRRLGLSIIGEFQSGGGKSLLEELLRVYSQLVMKEGGFFFGTTFDGGNIRSDTERAQ